MQMPLQLIFSNAIIFSLLDAQYLMTNDILLTHTTRTCAQKVWLHSLDADNSYVKRLTL